MCRNGRTHSRTYINLLDDSNYWRSIMSQSCLFTSDGDVVSKRTRQEERPPFPELALDCLGLNECIYTLSTLLLTHEKRCGTGASEYKALEHVTPYSFCYPGEDPSIQLHLFEACVAYSLQCLGKYRESNRSPEKLNETLGQFCEGLGVGELSQIHESDLQEGYGEIPCKVLYLLLSEVAEARGISVDPAAFEELMPEAPEEPGAVEDFAEQYEGSPQEVDEDSLQMEASIEKHRLNAEGACSGEERTWRVHLEETRKYKELFDEYLVPVGEALQKQQQEIQAVLTRVDEKEKWLQHQFHEKVAEHASLRTALESQKTLYNDLVEKKKSLAATLASTQQQLQQNVKLLEQKYSKVTDTQPLEDLTSTLKTLKEEIKQMDVRIGVLMHASLREAVRVRSIKSSGKICGEDAKNEAEDSL